MVLAFAEPIFTLQLRVTGIRNLFQAVSAAGNTVPGSFPGARKAEVK
jgi:hypothetical protein